MPIQFFESELQMPLTKFPLRSTLVKTDKASVLISPIDFSGPQIEELKREGVTDVVASGMFHHLFIPKAMKLFPQATVWCVPGLPEKRPDIAWQKVLGRDQWPYNEIDVVVTEGAPKITEAVFFVKSEKTVIVTDLCFNIKNPESFMAKLLFKAFGTYKKFAVSRMVNLMMKDRGAFKSSMEKVLAWDFDRLVPAHGEIVEQGAREMLRRALRERGVG